MRMTIDGSGDNYIRLQGVEAYSFCDADGGAAGAESAPSVIGDKKPRVDEKFLQKFPPPGRRPP